MSNIHGLDFLRQEHLDSSVPPPEQPQHETTDATPAFAAAPSIQDVRNKPDLEKQFDILAFLQAHRGTGSCLGPSVIYRATGIDLDEYPKVAEMLQRNPKVRVEMVPDPENPALSIATYAYQAKYATVRDRTTLLAQINRMTEGGVPMRDLLDSYATVADDLSALITAGDILAIANTEDKDKILFPRGEAFLVELDGLVSTCPTTQSTAASVTPQSSQEEASSTDNKATASSTAEGQQQASSQPASSLADNKNTDNNNDSKKDTVYDVVQTDVNPLNQIRRGEAVCVGGQWFRVSSAVKEGVPLSEQPARAQAPNSVVSLQDLSKRNEIDGYIRPFNSKTLPLDGELSRAAQDNLVAAKTARERLQKLAHGARSSGGGGGSATVVSQLTSSQASASNPTTLAASLGGGGKAGGGTSSFRRPYQNQQHSDQQGGGHQQAAAQFKQALQEAATDPALSLFSHSRRHGCTTDIRDLYLATRKYVPESDHELHQVLLKHKLLEPGEQMRRPRLKRSTNLDNDGKPKKRRYYEPKKQRMTNTHLEGTELGAVLARAAEQQRQGRAVGDGGM